MLALTEKEIQSIDGMLESKMAWARSKSAEAEQLALDCTRLLSCTEDRCELSRNMRIYVTRNENVPRHFFALAHFLSAFFGGRGVVSKLTQSTPFF